ncbi:MAG: sulfate reduction electron transfer complex DsrMKJOP subunit DsrJ [Candidatus Electryonea clarkiae]|nr:sulfate reduction electron transfer complex DsrMKJOP subunit DsrJ [Candidatus Electryonea clarkiae]MDP8288359.1 sulfate reduction electron transfer complex DsrMKJOP subunit DsrJ [Candidatus Electryonea clarkiae]
MFDGGKIITGLIIFLIIITFPVWYNAVNGQAGERPEIEIATKDTPGKNECVLPADVMRTDHMDLVMQWRDEVVRHDDRTFKTENGREFTKSLTHTCLDCHSNKDAFCDQCHNYVGVDPYCWDCHIVPQDFEKGVK